MIDRSDWDAIAASRDDELARAMGERSDLRKTDEDVMGEARWEERRREHDRDPMRWDAGLVSADCEACDGHGAHPCTACGGTGRGFAHGVIDCPACGGSGVGTPCPGCEGSGKAAPELDPR